MSRCINWTLTTPYGQSYTGSTLDDVVEQALNTNPRPVKSVPALERRKTQCPYCVKADYFNSIGLTASANAQRRQCGHTK